MEVTQDVTRETFVIGLFPETTQESKTPARTVTSKKPVAVRINVLPTHARKAKAMKCRLPVVRFKINDATLQAGQEDAILSGLKKCGITHDTGLVIVGHTCDLGPAEFNRNLSLRRAAVVADFLKKHGYAIAMVQGKGSENPVTQDPARRYLNRRVEIKVQEKN
ncbi:OmpA family protein [Desulfolithobacter dissulfuricans]|nr:OmpA family protein [Desulfolithobacter dissulfuricans]